MGLILGAMYPRSGFESDIESDTESDCYVESHSAAEQFW